MRMRTVDVPTHRVVGVIVFAMALVPTSMYLREWLTGELARWQTIAGPAGGLVLALAMIVGPQHRRPYYTCLAISVLMTALAAYYTGR